MSPPIRDGSGSSIRSIRLGDGTEISEVRTGAGDVLFGAELPDRVLTKDLVAWYRFEDGDARDYASNAEFPSVTWGDSTAYDGTVNGATFQSSGGVTDFKNGQNSGAFNFDDGQNDEIEVSNVSDFPDKNGHSLTLWVKFDNVGNNYESIFGNGFLDKIPFSLNRRRSGLGEGIQYIFPQNGSSTTQIFQGTNPQSGTYIHCAGTYDGSTGKLYINGTQVNSGSFSSSKMHEWGVQANEFYLGSYFDNEDFLDGDIDDVRIYNRALTDSEISDIYNATEP